MQRSTRTHRGFSLVELILAMAVSGILVGAMGAALVTASSALERGEGAVDYDRIAAEALDDLQSDLAEATSFFERTTRTVWFSVPDRDGDDVEEHIRYSWSGNAGDPLLRSTNGGTEGIVAANVQSLNIGFFTRAGPKQTTSKEKLVAGFTSHAGATESAAAATDTSWVGQIVRPSFAGDVVSWKATKVRLRLRQSGAADATSRIDIVSVDANNAPGDTVYATTTIKESLLSAALRTDELVFSSCLPIPAGQPVAIVIRSATAGAASTEVGFLTSATPTMPFNLWRATSTNSGGTWQGSGQTQNNYFEILGTVTTEAR